ncbi:hypothetical protein [Reyranella sp.]|uniref:hypothetical protein n=1 Tax=Reyranella sp. TaxID=1929291 RepID=UPI003F716E7A
MAPSITEEAASVFRDFEIADEPDSLPWQPRKSEIRALFELVDSEKAFVRASAWDDPDEAAAWAWANRQPLLADGVTAALALDFSDINTAEARHQHLMEVIDWQQACFTTNNGRVVLQLPDGYHEVSAWRALGDARAPVHYVYGDSPVLDIRGSAAPVSIDIASIAYGARDVDTDIYSVTIVAAEALPVHVVPGYCIGTQNVDGDNDAGELTGGLKVKTISPDRLTITADLICRRTEDLVSPTSLDTSSTFVGLLASQLIVPPVCLGIDTVMDGDTPVWSGGADEGYFNILKGGRIELFNIGLCWIGGSGVGFDQDLVFYRDPGSVLFTSRCVLVGAGDKVVRGYGHGANAFLGFTCLGGGGTANNIVSAQAGAGMLGNRSCFGGSRFSVINSGDGCHFSCSGIVVATGSVGCIAVGVNSGVVIPASKIIGGRRGVYALLGGKVQIASTTEFWRNSQAMDWLSGSFVYGLVHEASLATNVVVLAANTLIDSGGWYKDALRGLTDPGTRISIPVAGSALSPGPGTALGTATIPLSGTGGQIRFAGETTCKLGFTLDIDIVSPGSDIFAEVHSGADIVIASGDIAAPLNAGKVTVSVYLDGSVYNLKILNEQGAGRAWRFIAGPGDLQCGTPVVA